ncbi:MULTISPECIES: 4Fe-4S binding protein [unclassified Marinovum]
MGEFRRIAALAATLCCAALAALAEPLPRETIADLVAPPMELGPALDDNGLYSLLNSGGAEAGYVFQTEPLAPLPGFSGAAINVLVTMDLEGRFLDMRLLEHNEPIFVSGLGQAPFHAFFEQYPGLSINDSLVVGSPYGAGAGGSSLIYLDGVTKATASVRIAHESILAAALAVARDKLGHVNAGPPAYPNPGFTEDLTWADLVEQGLARNLRLTNAEIDAKFAGTLWADDDPEAQGDPDGLYLDFWVVDIGPKSIARAALSDDSYDDLQRFLEISPNEEPLLVIEAARHGLVSEDFVRNTAPDWIGIEQNGFPVALRDGDLIVGLHDDLPDALHDAADFGAALILRTDRRLGFDPASDYTLQIAAVREHGMFQPEIGTETLTLDHTTDARFFSRPEVVKPSPPWLDALRNRSGDMIGLAVFLTVLLVLIGPGQKRLAGHRHFTAIRLSILAAVTGFIGWWGQGQLSIVTPLATLRTAMDGGSFAFLLYDPFSLLIWAVAILGFVFWGRALFCGWLCPFGAMQEFTGHLGRLLRLPQIEPSARWDKRLKSLKYVALLGLVAIVFLAPDATDKAAEIEPFKTAVTTFFIREWYYVAYAVFWLVLSMVLYKGFCRYVCPLGAVMAIGGMLRERDWIPRRTECGSPCQLCRVKCQYGAIEKTGKIAYSECFGCLDCVTIHDDKTQCVPLILAAKGRNRRIAAE